MIDSATATRSFAHLDTIAAIDPLAGADGFDLARVGDWAAVVPKGQFKVGDPVIHFDPFCERSLMPGPALNDLPTDRDDLWVYADQWISDNAAHLDTAVRDWVWSAIVAAVNPAWVVGYSERLQMQRTARRHVREVRPGLWGIGAVGMIDLDRMVVVTGSLATTAAGEQVAHNFAQKFADHGWHVAVGGSYGIDTAALRGALAAHATPPVVWTANGFDALHPLGNAHLFDQVLAAGGAILSTTPPDTTQGLTRDALVRRADTMMASAQAVVIVQGAYRSGACGAASRTTTPVFGVPGPITSAHHAGVHELIKAGRARLVTSPNDVLTALADAT